MATTTTTTTTTTTNKAGFRGTDSEVYYLALGRAWVVSTPDRDDTPAEIDPADVPAEAIDCNGLLTPDEAIDYCLQIERGYGLRLRLGDGYFVTLFASGEGDDLLRIEETPDGRLCVTTNAETRRVVEPSQYAGWSAEDLRPGLLAAGVPADVVARLLDQAGLGGE